MALRSFLGRVAQFLLVLGTTLLGLVAVTFFIGRVVPIDPVIAIVGDRAPAHVYERARQELGLDRPLIEQFLQPRPERRQRKIVAADLGHTVTRWRALHPDRKWADEVALGST